MSIQVRFWVLGMKKINQSYSYCDKQLKWLNKVFSSAKISDLNRTEVEREFKNKFGIYRSFQALHGKAKRAGYRPKHKKLTVGKSIKKGRDGESLQVCCNVDPPRYMSLPRYLYQEHHGVKLKRSDVIVHLDGDVMNCNIDNLEVVSRSELLHMNRIQGDAPIKTKILIARVEMTSNNIAGRGDWSKEEVDWVMRRASIDKINHSYWCDLANRFNARFGKNRSNIDLIMKFYSQGGHRRTENRKKEKHENI